MKISLSKLLIMSVIIGYYISQIDTLSAMHSCMENGCDFFLFSPSAAIVTEFRALVVKPSSNNLNYAAEAIPLPVPSPNWNIFNINPHYRFGFDVGVMSIFHGTDTMLQFNWEHFKSSSCASAQFPSNNMVGPFFEIGPDASTYKQTQGKVTFHYDSVSLNYGQYVYIGDHGQANLFVGLNGGRIKQELFSQFASLDNTTMRTITIPSHFIGAGPQIGLTFCYDIIKGFCFTGKASAAIIVGPLKNHTEYSATSPFLVELNVGSPNIQRTCVQKSTQVIPWFYQRLGFGYKTDFCDHYSFAIEAGYEARIYNNAIQSVDMSSEVDTPPLIPDTVGVFARTFRKTLSNFSLAGPYVGLNVGF